MPIDRLQFEYLRVHANLLATLAIEQLSAELGALPEGLPDALSDDERAAMEIDSLARLKAQEAAWIADADTASDRAPDTLAPPPGAPTPLVPTAPLDADALKRLREHEEVAIAQTAAARAAASAGASSAHAEDDGGAFDIARELECAYTALPALQAENGAAFADADSAAIDACLATLAASTSPAPLTQAQDAGSLASWLALYTAGNRDLDLLLFEIRKVETP